MTPRQVGLTRTVVAGSTRTIERRRDELDTRFPGLIDALTTTTTTGVPSRGRHTARPTGQTGEQSEAKR